MGIFDMLMGGGSFGGLGGGFGGGFSGGGSHHTSTAFPHYDPVGDAVKEVVTETIKDALDPERKERRREAERCNEEAREAIDEADRLRSHDLVRLQSRAQDLDQSLRGQVETLAELKARIGRDIEQEITPQIQRFRSFDIQQRVGRAPSMASSGASSSFPSLGGMASSAVGGFAGVPSLLDLLGDETQGDLDIAQENRCKARTYLAKVRRAVVELQAQVSSMAATLASLRGEEETLRELHRRLKLHMTVLSEAQRQQAFSQQEADAYQTICDIASMIRDSLHVQICNADGSTAGDYDRYLTQLKRIVAEVPEQPSLHRPLHLHIPVIYY